MLEIKIEGFGEIQKRLATFGANARKVGAVALYQEGETIKVEAVKRCPKSMSRAQSKKEGRGRGKTGGSSPGELRRSIWVQRDSGSGDEIQVTLHAGGGLSAPYALAVHEHPSEYSPPSWMGVAIDWSQPGTGPKFLEGPANEWKANGAENLNRRIDINTLVR